MAATTIDGKIIDGLLGHFGGFALPVGVGVAYPGMSFSPNAGEPYVELSVLNNAPIQRMIAFGKEPERLGIFQASVFWPEGQGIVKATDLAAQIGQHFARGTKIRGAGIVIWIIDEPVIASPIQETAWLQVPLSIRWHVYP